jgi:molecular chaperone GrpE
MSEEKKTQAAEEAAEEILEETSPETQAGQPEEQPDPMALLQQELDETKDRLMRTLAEYDNFRKRTQKEREALYPEA